MLETIESCSELSVVFIGDTIYDEYHYVEPLGKSPKENIVPTRYVNCEKFIGGTDAAANHARSFCKRVTVCSGGTPVRKVRMVDKTYFRKLFEVHYEEKELSVKPFDVADITVITDFGHGFITKQMIPDLVHNQFVAVNAQTNSSNIGFNLITKYPTADYAVIDEPEARLAAQDRDSPIQDVLIRLAKNRFSKMIITLGKNGAIGWSEKDGLAYSKAYTDKVIDTMGAGDAFFAVTAPMAKHGSIKDLIKIGNAAGALKTQIVGHRSSVTKKELIQFIKDNP